MMRVKQQQQMFLQGVIVCLMALQSVMAAPPTANKAKPIQLTGDSPLTQFFNAKKLEKAGKTDQAIKIYTEVVKGSNDKTPWGNWARLELLRLQLETGDIKSAQKTISQLPEQFEDTLTNRQYKLWQDIYLLHQLAEEIIVSDDIESNISNVPSFKLPRIPTEYRLSVAKSFDVLRGRLVTEHQEEAGIKLLESVLQTTSNGFVQTVALGEIAQMSAREGQIQTANAACRAYWLSAVDFPELFTDTVRTVMSVMKAGGASREQIEAMRQFQMRGEKDGKRPEVDPLKSGRLDKQFFSKHINSASSELARARMFLLDGELGAACHLLDEQIRKSEPGTEAHSEALMLIRMAMALHDGHMHQIDRYERFLYSGDASAVNPLAAIMKEYDSTKSAALMQVQ